MSGSALETDRPSGHRSRWLLHLAGLSIGSLAVGVAIGFLLPLRFVEHD